MIRRLLVSLSVLSLIFSLASCRLEKESEGRVIVLAMDGIDPHAIDLLMSEGKLPNFARMKTDGAYGPLLSQKPLLSPVVWTTVATGKTPDQHRIGHFVAINPQTGEQLPVTSQMRRSRALWNILSDAGRSVAVTGWWATWPAETVNGSVVSDHVAYHFLFDQGLEENQEKPGLTYPPQLRDEIAPLVVKPADIDDQMISRYLDIDATELDKPFDFQDPVAHFRWALAASETYKNIGLHLWHEKRPDDLFVYIEGVDSTSHLFGHVFRNDSLAGELAAQKARYGRAVEEMYVHADEILGEFMAAMDDDTTIIVLSDHGFELGAVLEDPSMSRDFRRVSERYHRLRGVLYMYGRDVVRGSIPNPSILDIAPTILALNGLPAAADMSGRVLQSAIETTAPERVATYESSGTAPEVTATETSNVDAEVLEKLRSLGYLGATSPTGDASLAMVLFEQGRYDEAAAAFESLIEESPDNADLRSSYAGVLGQLGRYDDAIAQLDTAISIKPLSPQAYHNRAVAYERKGDRDAAVADYRRAIRYGNFGPSRDALTRLGVSPSAEALDEPRTRAVQLAEEAASAAKRGDYPTAQRLLDEAETAAPDFALVHQYRSNVSYLAGDIDGAIRALERGLELEPDNVLFRENLKTLRAKKAANQP